MDALLALLRERRDDEAFWAELADLTRRIEDAQVRPDLIHGAEVLGGADVTLLLSQLRAALPDGEAPSAAEWVRSAPAAGALAALLLLGSSLGCAVCPEAGSKGITGEDNQTVYCALVDLIQDADIDFDTQTELLDCLPHLEEQQREDLLEQFENASQTELAQLLEDLAAGPDCDVDCHDH